MPTKLNDLFGRDEYDQMLAHKYIKVQKHPMLPLYVANYTDAAVRDGVWNATTRTCRGLIFDDRDRVVARPFAKFFNHGEDADLDMTALGKPEVYEKQDGSLGVAHVLPTGDVAVATRGSFTSEQAVWATNWLRKNMPDFAPEPGTTQLVEIIYPRNRIVVDYQGYEGLVSLAVIDNKTGRTLADKSAGWTGDVVEKHVLTLDEVLAGEDRPNREGYVLHFPDHDVRVKIKHPDYVRLHRIVTGATEFAVWRAVAEDDNLDQLLDGAPQELRDWVSTVAGGFDAAAGEWCERREAEFRIALRGLRDPKRADRREFAARAVQHIEPGALFALLDGKPIKPMALAKLRPHGTGDRFAGGW